MAALLLLGAKPAVAEGLVETNHMPLPLHALMETTGHAVVPTNLVLAPTDINSLRILPPIKNTRYILFKPPPPKRFWSFWNSLGIKYVGHNHDPLNVVTPLPMTPYSALAQFEYDFTYSFDF